ncbi:MAG: shikimate dehydrogenase family protein [Bacillota bacterium]
MSCLNGYFEPDYLLGLFGADVSRSLSPTIHNYVYQERKQKAIYKAFSINEEQVGPALNQLASFEFKGLNITNPYKELVIKFLDEVSEAGSKIGAVNTIKVEDNGLSGYNTDYLAVKEIISDNMQNSQYLTTVLLLGAGGAARSVLYALSKFTGFKILLGNRTESRAKKLIEEFSELFSYKGEIKYVKWTQKALGNATSQADIIIEATGLSWQEQVYPGYEKISSHHFVFDLSYPQNQGPLSKYANEQQACYLDGKNMLLIQAREADKIWFPAKDNQERKRLFQQDIF